MCRVTWTYCRMWPQLPCLNPGTGQTAGDLSPGCPRRVEVRTTSSCEFANHFFLWGWSWMRRTHSGKGISPSQGWGHVLSPLSSAFIHRWAQTWQKQTFCSPYITWYAYIDILTPYLRSLFMFLSSNIFPVSFFFPMYTQYFWSQTDCAVSLQMSLIMTTSMAL